MRTTLALVVLTCIALLAQPVLTLGGPFSAMEGETGTVTGKVTAFESGTPLADVDVSVDSYVQGEGWSYYGTYKTGPDGLYTLTVPAGTVRIYFEAANRQKLWWNGATAEGAAQQITVGAGATVSNINAAMKTFNGFIKGTVTIEADKRTLAGISVSADQHDSTTGWNYVGSTTTADDGTYTLEVPPGEIRVYFQGDTAKYATQYYNGVLDKEKATSLNIKSGDVKTGINAAMFPPGVRFTLGAAPAAVAFGSKTTFTVTVQRGAGTALTGYRIGLEKLTSGGWLKAAEFERTDTNGKCTFTLAPTPWSETYRATFAETDDAPVVYSNQVTVRTIDVISVPKGKPTARKNVAFTVTGTMKPMHSPAKAYLVIVATTKGMMKTFACRCTNSGGATNYSALVKLPKAGVWKLVAKNAKDPGHIAAASKPATIKVR